MLVPFERAGAVTPEGWLKTAGINLAVPRTRAAMEAEGFRSTSGSAVSSLSSTEINSSVILICKVFLGNCQSTDAPEEPDAAGDGETTRSKAPPQVRYCQGCTALCFWHGHSCGLLRLRAL